MNLAAIVYDVLKQKAIHAPGRDRESIFRCCAVVVSVLKDTIGGGKELQCVERQGMECETILHGIDCVCFRCRC